MVDGERNLTFSWFFPFCVKAMLCLGHAAVVLERFLPVPSVMTRWRYGLN